MPQTNPVHPHTRRSHRPQHGRLPEGWDRDYSPAGVPFYWHSSWPEERTTWDHPTNGDFAERLKARTAELEAMGPPPPWDQGAQSRSRSQSAATAKSGSTPPPSGPGGPGWTIVGGGGGGGGGGSERASSLSSARGASSQRRGTWGVGGPGGGPGGFGGGFGGGPGGGPPEWFDPRGASQGSQGSQGGSTSQGSQGSHHPHSSGRSSRGAGGPGGSGPSGGGDPPALVDPTIPYGYQQQLQHERHPHDQHQGQHGSFGGDAASPPYLEWPAPMDPRHPHYDPRLDPRNDPRLQHQCVWLASPTEKQHRQFFCIFRFCVCLPAYCVRAMCHLVVFSRTLTPAILCHHPSIKVPGLHAAPHRARAAAPGRGWRW